MWKLKKSNLYISLIWSALFIIISIILTIVFCLDNVYSLVYHIFLFPIYFAIGFILSFIFNELNKKLIQKNNLFLVIVVFTICSISFLFRDFRSAFSILEYSSKDFSLEGIINSGCREMFFFLSFFFSSLIIILLDFFSKNHKGIE